MSYWMSETMNKRGRLINMNRIAIVTALAMAGNVHLCAADVARAGTEIDFAKIPDVRIFKGDETIGYRDPAAWYEDGVFHRRNTAE